MYEIRIEDTTKNNYNEMIIEVRTADTRKAANKIKRELMKQFNLSMKCNYQIASNDYILELHTNY